MRSRWGAGLLALCCLSFPSVLHLGCTARRGGEAVRRITFDVEGRSFPRSLWAPESNRAMRQQMTQQRSSWQSLVFPGALEPTWLSRTTLAQDGERLQLWLAGRGYFDAEFLRWEVIPHRKVSRRLRPVTVRGHIELGPASRVRTVAIVGVDPRRRILRRRLREASAIQSGDIYTHDAFTQTLATLRRALQDEGFAFAQVTGSVDAWPAQQAVDVHIDVVLGPRSVFGPVELRGVRGMPEARVEASVTVEEGDPFRPSAIEATRAALFGLGVFSVVDVTPITDHPETSTVPVLIEVRSAKWRRLKLGPGLEGETGQATAYGAGEWEHSNLFGRLWHFKQTARAGATALVPRGVEGEAFSLDRLVVAPTFDLSSVLSIPHAIGPAWEVDLSGRVQMGVEPGYRYFSPELAPGLVWRPRVRRGREDLSLTLSYHARYFDYFDFSVDIQDIEDSPLGLDLTDPYVLSMLTQGVVWDGRDDRFAPGRGWFASLAVSEAGGPLQGSFDFVRSEAEVRAYRALPVILRWKPRLVVAGRLGAGIISTYGQGPSASVPYSERLYLGGGTSVRGWVANRLGPSVAVTNTATGEVELLPAGGLLSAFGNFELRKELVGGIGLAAFTDVGRVWPEVSGFRLAGLQWSLGGGLRYATVIGPIRADVGARLGPHAPELPRYPRWTVHFGLSEAF